MSEPKRSRSGCSTCKTRHLKCDESKPVCLNCTHKNLRCRYGLKLQFKEDLESKNKAFGRQGVWSKRKNHDRTSSTVVPKDHNFHRFVAVRSQEKLMLLNYTYDDFESPPPQPLQLSMAPSSVPHALIRGFDDHGLITSNSDLVYTLVFYIESVSPMLNPVNMGNLKFHHGASSFLGGDNTKMVVHEGLDVGSLLQYSQKYPHVLSLMLGLSSIYLSKSAFVDKTQSHYWRMQGIRLRNLGLQHMAKSFQGESAEIRVDLWVSFLIITLYYLADECNDNWSNQLRSCQQLLRQSEVRAVTDPVERKLFTYTVEFFSYQESMGRTACHKSNVFNEEWTKHLGQAEGEVVLIPWMGCDKRLIRIVSDITDLSISALPQQTFREKRAAIMDELENIKMKHFNPDNFLYMIDNSLLDQSPASCDDNYGCLFYYYDQISDEAANMEEFCFLLTCEIKRLCGLLYATSCLYYQSPSQPSIVSLVTKIFNYTKFIIISNNFFWSSLTWPLYMISTQLDFADPMSEVQKLDILNMFDMIDQKGLGNVGKAKSAVETLWKKRSLYDRAKGKEKKTYWEFVVDPVCNISLV